MIFSFFLPDVHWCQRISPPDKPTKKGLRDKIIPGLGYGILRYMISLYRSPSQTHDEFYDFLLNFEQFLCDAIARNPFFVLIIGDFIAKTAKWWRNDTATIEGTKIDSITNSYPTVKFMFVEYSWNIPMRYSQYILKKFLMKSREIFRNNVSGMLNIGRFSYCSMNIFRMLYAFF